MQRALVDATPLIAGTYSSDQYHPDGRELLHAFDRQELPRAVVVSPVLKETLDFLLERKSSTAAVDVLDRLQRSAGFELVDTVRADFEYGKDLFRTFDGLGLADAMVVAYAERTDTEYVYSFDDDYDEPGSVTRLDAAVDPYSADR
jgi:predicted nucleic acid-binding protein